MDARSGNALNHLAYIKHTEIQHNHQHWSFRLSVWPMLNIARVVEAIVDFVSVKKMTVNYRLDCCDCLMDGRVFLSFVLALLLS